jgi:hypothetical protein
MRKYLSRVGCDPVQAAKTEKNLCSEAGGLACRAYSEYLPENQAQIEGRGVNQRTLADIVLAS